MFFLFSGELTVFCSPHSRGSAVAKIIGSNVKNLQKFSSTVKMWVFEETVNGRKLTDIINNDHENVKYLPGHKLPENVVRLGRGGGTFGSVSWLALSGTRVCMW